MRGVRHRLTQPVNGGRVGHRSRAGLVQILHRALQLQEMVPEAADAGIDPHYEYAEARRLASERYFVSRNPTLIRRAKERAGRTCGYVASTFRLCMEISVTGTAWFIT